MFKIGDFSKLTFVSIRMLRYYDEIGLFKPAMIDDFTNYRYYSANQIPLLNKIVGLKNLGFKADEIRMILNESNEQKQIELLQNKKDDIAKQIHDDEQRLAMLGRFIENYNKEEKSLKFEAVIKKVPAYKVAALKAVIPAYNSEGELWGKFMGIIGKNNMFSNLVQGGYCYARFFEDEYKEGQVHIEIGDEVHKLLDSVDGIEYKELEPIEEALCVLVAGNYEPNIQEGFNFVAKWMDDNQYDFAGASRTKYIKGPESEQDPANYLTEIQVPVKKRG